MRSFRALILLFVALPAAAGEPPATTSAAAPPVATPTVAAPSERERRLEQRLDALEQAHRGLVQTLEQEHAAAARSRDLPTLSFGPTGFALRSGDGRSWIKLRGLLQVDGRAYLGDDKTALTDTFLLRRARPILEASFFGWLDAKFTPDFGQNKVVIEDAYLDIHPFTWLRLRAGKFKPPVGLERLQSAGNIRLVERGFPTALVPNRDLGAQLYGELGGGTLLWAVGLFNGVVDGSDVPDLDAHDGKDWAARIFLHPLRPLKQPWFDNFGIGVAGTYGQERGTQAVPNLPTYKSPGQVTFFSYLTSDVTNPAGTTVAFGDRWRVAPQLYYYVGPVGLLAEYVRSSQDVFRNGNHGAVVAQAWQLQISALLTPHDVETWDAVTPRRPVAWGTRGYGAFEIVARYQELLVGVAGDATFPTYADPNKSASGARAFGLALNWYANTFFRVVANYERTDFVGGGPAGTNRPSENALLGRLQVAF
jgi:phosphate-selective porin OprO/OprP